MVEVCPICGSLKFNVDKSNIFLDAIGSNENYVCEKCGNVFPFPLETEGKVGEGELNEEISVTGAETAAYDFFHAKNVLNLVGVMAVLIGLGSIIGGMSSVAYLTPPVGSFVHFGFGSMFPGFIILIIGVVCLFVAWHSERPSNKRNLASSAKKKAKNT